MADDVIENPIVNSPYEEPGRHFEFTDDGITNNIIGSRCPGTYFVPVPRSRERSARLQLSTEWTRDRQEENKNINRIRERVADWRRGGYSGITPTTLYLLEHWTDPEREKKLFFCQIEALETLIYITEAASKFGDNWILNDLRPVNDSSNPGLNRIGCKMATGSGKTFVTAMLISWQTLNKLENPQDSRFSDTFLIITPGIPIKDRLPVLLPNDPDNYCRKWDILSGEMRERLHRANILITNYHSFLLEEKNKASRLAKKKLRAKNSPAFTETPAAMVRRVIGSAFHNKKNIIVINDEAHHC